MRFRYGLLLVALLWFPRLAGAQEAGAFRFLHITDTHVTAGGDIAPLRDLVGVIGRMSPAPAFVVDTGDVTEAGRPEEFDRFLNGVAGLSIPFYAAPGNHDVRWSSLGKEAFTRAFQKRYRSFDREGCHFVLLDSTVLLEHWGHFDAEQLKWLEGDLKRQKKTTPVLLFFHHPLGPDHAEIDNQEDLFRLIAPYNVVAIFVGHGHSDLAWRVNGVQCVMARGLYQGSYHLVDVTSGQIVIRRVRREDAGKEPAVVATLPRTRGPGRAVAFGWDDPNIALLARRRFVAELWADKKPVKDASLTAAYALDEGEMRKLEPDTRPDPGKGAPEGRFMAQFETKGLSPGAHRLRIRITAPDGETFTREEAFITETMQGQPRRVWDDAYRTEEGVQASPVLAEGLLYAGALDGKLHAIDPANGRRKWVAATGGAICGAATVAEGTVYVGSQDHYLYAFDARSGRMRWKFDAGAPLFASPAVAAGVVCIGGDRRIVGLDATTGRPRWQQETGGFFQSRAVAADGVFYLGGWDNTLYALDAATGAPRWKAPMGRANGGRGALQFYYAPAIASPAVGEGRVYVCSNDGLLHAVNIRTGQDDWAVRAPAGGDTFGYSSPVLANGRIYVGGLGSRGDCYGLDAGTGAVVWRCSTGAENYDSSPVIAGGRVVIGSVRGRLSWIDAAGGKLLFQYALEPGHCFGSPAVSERRAYLGSMNGQVYAVEAP